MDIAINWFFLGILFLIMEFFSFKSLFFLPGALISFVLYFLIKFDYIKNIDGYLFIFFLLFSTILGFLFRILFYNKINHKDGKNNDYIGEHIIVQIKDGNVVAHINGIYYKIESNENIKGGDNVQVISIEGGTIHVKKFF